MKICLKCNKFLSSKSFHINKYRYDGLENYCRQCYGCQYNHTLKFTFDIIENICMKFVDLKFMCSITLVPKYTINTLSSNKLIYLCVSGTTGVILKVGQTVNWKNRCTIYTNNDHSPITMYFFEANSWKEQDELEGQIRLFLEDIGHILPWDNTSLRLQHINL